MLYVVCYFVNQVFFISTSGEPSVKRIDLTLAGPTVTRLVQKRGKQRSALALGGV